LPKFSKKLHIIRAICGGKGKLEKNFVVGKWCRRYRTKREQEHLLLLLTKRETKFLQASKEIAEGELHSEDLPEHKNATRTEKCPIQNEQIENRALESFPRECSNVAFPTLKRGVFHDVTRCKGLGFRVRARAEWPCPRCSIMLLSIYSFFSKLPHFISFLGRMVCTIIYLPEYWNAEWCAELAATSWFCTQECAKEARKICTTHLCVLVELLQQMRRDLRFRV
jgi:hypothetical protein